MWAYNYTNELYHYGVKGMKWGVRNSQEVKSVNKSYKKELRGLKKERDIQNLKSFGKAWGTNLLSPVRSGDLQFIKEASDTNKKYKSDKKALQEKYESSFQKAKKAAEDRLSSPEEVARREAKAAKGKKAAKIALAAVGTASVAALAVHVAKNRHFYKRLDVFIPKVINGIQNGESPLASIRSTQQAARILGTVVDAFGL